MSQLSRRLRQAAAGSAGPTLVRDVFSVDPYTGTNAEQTINNGVDLTKGGLVWIKSRNLTEPHRLYDTSRGAHKYLSCNSTGAEQDLTSADEGVSAFNNNGFTIKGNDNADNNDLMRYVAWTFRECDNFFKIVTYTGDGTSNRTLTHGLGSVPGMIIVKNRDSAEDWIMWHRASAGNLALNSALANSSSLNNPYVPGSGDTINNPITNNPGDNTTQFQVNNGDAVNKNGDNYVAYVWAHHSNNSGTFGPDEDQDIIKCENYTGDASDLKTISVGFEPQFCIHKRVSNTGEFRIFDSIRGWPHLKATDASEIFSKVLRANTDGVETAFGDSASFTPITGNNFLGMYAQGSGTQFNGASNAYIYLAIAEDYEEATSRSEFFDIDHSPSSVIAAAPASIAPVFHSSTGQVGWGVTKEYDSTGNWDSVARVHQVTYLNFTNSARQTNSYNDYAMDFSGCITGTNNGWFSRGSGNNISSDLISWMWRRKKKLLNIQMRRGTGSNGSSFNHELGTTPEMIWIKNYSYASTNWIVYHKDLSSGYYLKLNDTTAQTADGTVAVTNATSTSYTVQNNNHTNGINYFYFNAFFATVEGISKVGSYTGSGNTQTIDCGFTNGVKFVLIKDRDNINDWLWFDTGTNLGIGNGTSDRYLEPNTTQPRSSAVSLIDNVSSGFQVPSSASETNTSSRVYIFYAIAE